MSLNILSLVTHHLSLAFQDIRYGVRKLIGMPGFTFIAVATLAVGIGANATIFSAVNAFLLRPFPYDGAERLVRLREVNEAFGGMSTAYANYKDWRERNKSFEDMACYRNSSPNVTGGEVPERIRVRQATHNLFPMLGVKPFLGREFAESDDRGDAQKTTVLSYGYWQRRFGGDENVIGQIVVFDGEPFAVIGVMPQDFSFPPFLSSQCDAWTPMGLMEAQDWFVQRYNHAGSGAVGKLKEGVSLESAQADMDVIAAQLREEYPDTNSGNTVSLAYYRDVVVSDVRSGILILMGSVVFVLLIVSANIGNLLLVRSSARVQEFAVRNALGAGRIRIVRQVLSEGFLLVILGGAAGLLVAMWGLDTISRYIPVNTAADPKEFFRIDGTVLIFSMAVALGSGLLFGLVPALQASRVNLNDALKDGGRSSTGGAKRKRFREILIVSELSLALMLLVGAGLMARSFYNYLQADPGFDPHNVLMMNLSLPEKQYADEERAALFCRNLLQRSAAVPGVLHVGAASNVLGEWQSTYYADGASIPERGQAPHAEYNRVSPDHFQAMGIDLLEGRYFTDGDVKDSQSVVIVDERFIDKYWPGESGVGKRVKIHSESPDGDRPWSEIVGVVRNVKHYGVDRPSRESIYMPMNQHPERSFTLVARVQGDPMRFVSPIRREITALDAQLPAWRIQTLMDVVVERSFVRRFITTMLSIFAVTAMLLAMLGVYGVMSYSVSQRSHEIGVRMALGAQAKNVIWLILKGGLTVTGIGVILGLAGSLLLNRFLASQLFGVGAMDVFTYAFVSALLIAIALLACYIPARKAAKTNPIETLRFE